MARNVLNIHLLIIYDTDYNINIRITGLWESLMIPKKKRIIYGMNTDQDISRDNKNQHA